MTREGGQGQLYVMHQRRQQRRRPLQRPMPHRGHQRRRPLQRQRPQQQRQVAHLQVLDLVEFLRLRMISCLLLRSRIQKAGLAGIRDFLSLLLVDSEKSTMTSTQGPPVPVPKPSVIGSSSVHITLVASGCRVTGQKTPDGTDISSRLRFYTLGGTPRPVRRVIA